MVFDEIPQRCLDEESMFRSENLTIAVTNQTLFCTQQMIHSQMVRLINFGNLYNRTVYSKTKEMVRKWINLKIVVSKLTYHLCMKFAW